MVICSLLTPHYDCHPLSIETTLWLPSVLSWYHILIAIHSLLKPHCDYHILSWHHTVITIHSSLKPYCECHLFPVDIKLQWPTALLGSTLWMSSVLRWYHPEIVIYSLLIPHCDDHLLSIDSTLCSHLLSLIPHCNSCLPCWYNSVMTSAIYTNEQCQNPCAMRNFQQ
jgi:hypothetical protein